MALAIRQAARLKPEIRLAQALSEFEAILLENQKEELRTYKTQERLYRAQTGRDETRERLDEKDVLRLTHEIDSRDRRGRCVGPRLINLLQSVRQFSTIVDTIVGSSQSIIAGTIWGVLKLTLLTASNYSSYFDSLSTLLMDIGRDCPRYKDIGLLYPQSNGLQVALCEYFTVVVHLCRMIVLFIRKPFIAQFSSAIWGPFRSESNQFVIDLQRLSTRIQGEAHLASMKELKTAANSASSLLAVSTHLQETRLRESRRAKSQFLESCSTYDYMASWKQARKSGTTDWVQQHEEYQNWLKSTDSATLWCTGLLGSGKTVLSANLVQHTMISVDKGVFGYFFCRYDDPESLKARTILGSIATQLLERATDPEAFKSVALPKTALQTSDQVVDHLLKLLPSERYTYFVLIDGLDECGDQELKVLMQHLKDVHASGFGFHIYVSSRPEVYRRYVTVIQPEYNLSMQDGDVEIGRYIDQELEARLNPDHSNSLCLGNPEIILKIRDALTKGSQGMFLWVAFQIDAICAEETDDGILHALDCLPADLTETFNRILQKMKTRKSRSATSDFSVRIFELVAAARRPLKLGEIRHALNVVPGLRASGGRQRLINDMRKTIDNCCSLLMVDEEQLTVHFTHHSVQQHLLLPPTDLTVKQYHIDLPGADTNLGEICVTYLSFDIVPEDDDPIPKPPSALESSAIGVPSAVMRTVPRSAVGKVALMFLKGSKSSDVVSTSQMKLLTSHAEKAFPGSDEVSPEQTFLSYARENWLFHTKGFQPATCISYMLWQQMVKAGNDRVVLPWEPNAWSNYEDSLLQWSITNQHTALLYLILSELEEKGRNWLLFSIVDAILDLRSDISGLERYYNTALTWALDNEHIEGAITLYRKGYWISNREESENVRGPETLLLWATQRGLQDSVRLLLDRPDIKINLRDTDGRSSLWWAAERGYENLVRHFLMRKDVDVEAKDREGRSPLHCAARSGHLEMVRMLLAASNIDVNSTDEMWRTPLAISSENGHDAVVELLLKQPNIDCNSVDFKGRTPLWWAAHKGHRKVVALLLAQPHIDLRAADDTGLTPLSAAAAEFGWHHIVVSMLRERDPAASRANHAAGPRPLMFDPDDGFSSRRLLFQE